LGNRPNDKSRHASVPAGPFQRPTSADFWLRPRLGRLTGERRLACAESRHGLRDAHRPASTDFPATTDGQNFAGHGV